MFLMPRPITRTRIPLRPRSRDTLQGIPGDLEWILFLVNRQHYQRLFRRTHSAVDAVQDDKIPVGMYLAIVLGGVLIGLLVTC